MILTHNEDEESVGFWFSNVIFSHNFVPTGGIGSIFLCEGGGGIMRFCPVYWLLPNEKFLDGILDKDTFQITFCGVNGAFHNVQ